MTLHLFLLILILVSAIFACTAKNLLLAAIALAASSVALTLILFEMAAPWAAIFELSVCAGLITVLFISTVSLVRKEEQFLREGRMRFFALPVFLAVFGVLFWLLSGPLQKALVPGMPAAVTLSVGDMLWNVRWFDIVGQLCIFVAGVLVVNAFFRSKNNG